MILSTQQMNNNREGSGRYKPLKRRKVNPSQQKEEFSYLNKLDQRMRFKNAKDPLLVAFDHLDRQPLKQSAIDFVKESVFDIIHFVSKNA